MYPPPQDADPGTYIPPGTPNPGLVTCHVAWNLLGILATEVLPQFDSDLYTLQGVSM
jgi:hypothetical protein